MSAKMIIPQAEADQGFGLLKDIVEMVKNPKAIDEAYERRRKAAQMSDDEINKAAEARALIAKADSLKDELKQKEDAIAASKIQHESNVLSHNQSVQKDNDRLNEWEKRLIAQASKQDEVDRVQAEAKKALVARAKEIEDNHAAWEITSKQREDAIAGKEAAQKDIDAVHKKENERLKAKAARLAAEAAS